MQTQLQETSSQTLLEGHEVMLLQWETHWQAFEFQTKPGRVQVLVSRHWHLQLGTFHT